MAAALVAGAKEPQWTNTTTTGMPYQLLGAVDCAGCDGACTGTCGKAPIGGQIDAAGFLLYESTRVNSIGYTTVELQNLFRLAQLSRASSLYFSQLSAVPATHAGARRRRLPLVRPTSASAASGTAKGADTEGLAAKGADTEGLAAKGADAEDLAAKGAATEDLFAYTSRTGGESSIRGALDYLVPFAMGRKNCTLLPP